MDLSATANFIQQRISESDPNRDKRPKVEHLEQMSKEDLIERVIQLQSHVTQLKNIITKTSTSNCSHNSKRKPTSNQRDFDFKKYNMRHVALKIAYLGWDYQGFAVQDDTNKTIEAALFEALIKTRLIENRATSCYHRCGRTDKGVSAFSQVISIDLRSNLLEGKGVKVREGGMANERNGDKFTEIKYVFILNKVLPPEIRVLAWCPVDPDFSARFSCKSRTYKYFFPHGNLDLERMKEASALLVGEHDYRNFCKMDVANGVVNYTRRIISVDIRPCQNTDLQCSQLEQDSSMSTNLNSCSLPTTRLLQGNDVTALQDEYEMSELTVCGMAFLWHQIRCIVALLFLIGQRKEEPQVISDLLNVKEHSCKPQYAMASEIPLVLFDCSFDDLEWLYDHESHAETVKHLQEMWTKHSVRTAMLKKMVDTLDRVSVVSATSACNEKSSSIDLLCGLEECLIPGNKPKIYKPLMQRETCESLNERINHYAKKRKLDTKD